MIIVLIKQLTKWILISSKQDVLLEKASLTVGQPSLIVIQ